MFGKPGDDRTTRRGGDFPPSFVAARAALLAKLTRAGITKVTCVAATTPADDRPVPLAT